MSNKKPLTIGIAKSKKPIEWVRYFKPLWSDEQCDYYLWELTCFPFSHEETINQLNKQLGKNDK